MLLKQERTLCVCELTAALDVSQPKMLRHLAAMRALDVVENCRVANEVFYRLNPGLPVWVRGVIDHLGDSVSAGDEFKEIGGRLKDMPTRPRRRADSGGAEADPKVSDAVSPESE